MCGKKQSIKKVYGRGSGKDCRLHVQCLNEMRMKQKALGGQISPFQKESCESYAVEEKVRYNAGGESHFSNSSCSKWNKFFDEQGLEEIDDAVTCSSVISASQLITETPRNTHKTVTKEESEIEKQTFQLPLLNSSEQETAFYDGSNKLFHTNMDTVSFHWNMENCFLSHEQREPDELHRKEYVGNPSLEEQQGNNTDSTDRNNGLVQQLHTNRNTYPALQHVPMHCNNVNISTKSQKVLYPKFSLLGDSEDDLDNILSF
ncbi:MRN complex-interacting protein isoform X2 [Zootermopsis nevadensis]|nr:MRN complex-interacting protein isoform X2 [Zootermopsis nevadensis]